MCVCTSNRGGVRIGTSKEREREKKERVGGKMEERGRGKIKV